MKFAPEDEFVTAIVRLSPDLAERLRQYPDDALLLIEGSYVAAVEVVRVGSLPDPDEAVRYAGFAKHPCPRCPERCPHSHVPA